MPPNRPMTRALRWLVPVVVLTLGAACNDEAAPEPTAEPTATSDPTPSQTPSEATTGERVEPVEVDVDFEERAADGSTFRVTRFEVTDTAVLVDVEFIVAAATAFIQLNHPDDPAVLVDDLGNEYEVVPPEGESTMIIDGGEQLAGTLSFQGPLHRGATTLQLMFNRQRDPEGDTVNDLLQPNVEFPPVDLTAGAS